jgi:tetratricopeptide (TPR) repeat protein
MKKAEVIALSCSLLFLVLLFGYLKFSSRLAKAERDARQATEYVAELQRNGVQAPKTDAEHHNAHPELQPQAVYPTVNETIDTELQKPPKVQMQAVLFANPYSDKAYLDGLSAQKNKEHEKALKLFLDVADRLPSSEEIVLKVGSCLLDLERYVAAIEHYKRGLKSHPESWMLKNSLAVAYRFNGQHEEAIVVYKEHLESQPNDAGSWFFLGWSYMAIKRNAQAEDAFLRSSAITSDWAGTWFNLGIVCEYQGKNADALMHYSRSLKIDPKDKAFWSRFRTLMLDEGPHAPYVKSWLEAPVGSDRAAYQARAKSKVDEVAYSLFPNLRDKEHPMWTALRASYATVQEKNPDFAKSPTIFLFCSIVAAERNGIPPTLTTESGTGILTIQNGTESDALVKVVSLSGPKLWHKVLVPVGGQRKIEGVPYGHFQILFALADSIDVATGELNGNPRASKFEKSLAYTTSSKLEGQSIITTTTSYSLTLHPVVGGNAKTEKISVDEFKKF